jgi:hypothetical protein
MCAGPANRFFPLGIIAANGEIESKLKPALRRIGNTLHPLFKVHPTNSLSFTVALQPPKQFRAQQQFRSMDGWLIRSHNSSQQQSQQNNTHAPFFHEPLYISL